MPHIHTRKHNYEYSEHRGAVVLLATRFVNEEEKTIEELKSNRQTLFSSVKLIWFRIITHNFLYWKKHRYKQRATWHRTCESVLQIHSLSILYSSSPGFRYYFIINFNWVFAESSMAHNIIFVSFLLRTSSLCNIRMGISAGS